MKRFFLFFMSMLTIAGFGLNVAAVNTPLVKPVYPKAAAYDDYDTRRKTEEDNPVDAAFLASVNSFSYASASSILSKQDENLMYSPTSLYMALSLAAAGAKGTTQSEMLKTLQLRGKTVSELAKQNGNLFRLLYCDNAAGKLKIANSVWLQQGVEFRKNYLNTAAKQFYASAFTVDFSKKSAGQAMGKWVSDQTNGVLSPDIPVEKDQLMAIMNTVYFKDAWLQRFGKADTEPDVFHLKDGTTVNADFMHTDNTGSAFWKGEGYTAATLGFCNAGKMVLILPNRGISLESLVSDPQKVAAMIHPEGVEYREVHFSVPKFSFGSSMKLEDLLQTMGIQTAFTDSADFSGMLAKKKAKVSKVIQETHISIDEDGAEAAAYTVIIMPATGGGAFNDQDPIEIKLDRPFLFAITSDRQTDVPLFIGVVSNPAET